MDCRYYVFLISLFLLGGEAGRIRCESWDYKFYTCDAGCIIDRVTLYRRVSPCRCILGKSFGWRGNRVGVYNGCRAEFDVICQ
ncbi:hypothetical protein ScPMuIL_011818 [Solemya velum]